MPSVNSIIDNILKHEGGYQNDKEDHGNEFNGQYLGTNYGITPKVLAAFRGVDTLTEDDMRLLTKEEAREIYKKEYVAPVMKWGLPAEAVPMAVDMAVNHGARNAQVIIQRAVGATADGAIGPNTIKKIKANRAGLAHKLVDQRKQFYEGVMQKLPHMEKYRKGWMKRAEEFRPEPRDLLEGM